MNFLSRDRKSKSLAPCVGKRDTDNTMAFIQDLRERVIGYPEISTDGWHPYKLAIRDAFGGRAVHGTIVKTQSVTDLRKDAAHRYSPAAVVAVSREVFRASQSKSQRPMALASA